MVGRNGIVRLKAKFVKVSEYSKQYYEIVDYIDSNGQIIETKINIVSKEEMISNKIFYEKQDAIALNTIRK